MELRNLLSQLRQAHIAYELGQCRDDAIMVTAHVPGERWEIELMDDGSLEIEVFRTDGTIHDESALENLFLRFSD
jgi:hypothetical protein